MNLLEEATICKPVLTILKRECASTSIVRLAYLTLVMEVCIFYVKPKPQTQERAITCKIFLWYTALAGKS